MGEELWFMKQGAYINRSEFLQPWIMLLLNFIAEHMDKEESEGSFQPLNIGTGWMIDENKKNDDEKTSAYQTC
jgi:hypothetical protein